MAMAAAQTASKAESSHRYIITVCAMLATLMQALDNTIANVALPHMQGSLSASRDQITWVLTSYVIAAAIMTAPVGFTITSVLCGLAQNLPQEVVFRFLQGCFGAALVPLSQAVMLDLYPIES